MNKELLVDFVEKTYDLSDREFKALLWRAIEIRLTARLHRTDKNTYKDLEEVFKEYDAA